MAPQRAEYHRALRQRRKNEGKCRYCEQPVEPRLARCRRHHLEHLRRGRAHYRLHRAEKLKKVAARRLRLIEQGRCYKCGIALDPEPDGGNRLCLIKLKEAIDELLALNDQAYKFRALEQEEQDG